MKNKKSEEKQLKRNKKKELQKNKRATRLANFKAFLHRHDKVITAFVAIILLGGFVTTIGCSIAGKVYASDEVVIGKMAPNVLEYDKPASKISRSNWLYTVGFGLDTEYDIFQQASLPIGSGDLGGSVLGETNVDKLIINEKTLWSGGPNSGQTDYNGDCFTGVGEDGLTESERYHKIQEYLLNGDEKSATKLFENRQDIGDNSGDYLAWGNVLIKTGHTNVKNYYRSLNIDNAIANVSYEYKGEKFNREFLASNPQNVIAVKLTAENNLDISIGFESKHKNSSVTTSGNYLRHSGKLDNGLNFCCYLKVVAVGGNVTPISNELKISDTKTAYIYISAATDYKQEFPLYRTGEHELALQNRVEKTVNDASEVGYESIKEAHINDYQNLYNRVKLNLGGEKPNLYTDKLVAKNKTIFLYNKHRRYLEQLLFNYGRYLLISCSRENSQLPANLQGVWNQTLTPPWGSDYHININLQMNYWPSYSTNLTECATPLAEFVDKLREPGRISAKVYTASEQELNSNKPDNEYGFIAHTESNPYGHTAPCGGPYVRALWSPAAVAWLMQNLYEKYEYTLDKQHLEYIYPIMKEALLFFERTMVMHNGRLVTAPAYSPEHGPITAGNTYEQSLVWQLLHDTIEAAKTLNLDENKVIIWQDMLSKLKPLEIGTSGQLKEWYSETSKGSMGQPKHRHMSHLLGLFPGDLINKNSSPEIVEAVKITLKARGKKSTGWAMGQRVNTYARLNDGESAYEVIKQLLTKGIYNNLFDAHPPFQIDGNFGYTSGVSEMLVQSNLNYIDLLPAIPTEWAQGELEGIRARGNFEVSMKWQNSKVVSASIASYSGQKAIVYLADISNYKVVNNDGLPVNYEIIDGKITFDTNINETYQIVLK